MTVGEYRICISSVYKTSAHGMIAIIVVMEGGREVGREGERDTVRLLTLVIVNNTLINQ